MFFHFSLGEALTGQCGFSGEEWNRLEYVLPNEWGLGLISIRQDSKADLFRWQSMVTLLGLWEHAGMERCETLGIKHIKTCSNSEM